MSTPVPVPTRKLQQRETISRVVVQETVYHHQAGGRTTCAGKPWHRILKSGEQAYQRILTLYDDEWVPLDVGWTTPASMVFIECCKQGGDCELGIDRDLTVIRMFSISGGESCRFEPSEDVKYMMRGPCKVTITAIPR